MNSTFASLEICPSLVCSSGLQCQQGVCNHSSHDVLAFPVLGVSVPLQLGLPDAIPPQYGALKEVSIHTVRARLRLLYHFSDLMYSSWRLLNLSPNNQVM